MKHPMQGVYLTEDGIARFRENKIVRFLLDAGPYDLNKLRLMNFDKDDWTQMMQLIGYSVSGFGELSIVHPEMVHAADRLAAQLLDIRAKARKKP